MADGKLLILSGGYDGSRATWNGGPRDAPKVRYPTAAKLRDTGLIEEVVDMRKVFGGYYRISAKGRAVLC